MSSAIKKAIDMILTMDPELMNILGTTAKLCLTSSVIALLIGVPLGVWLGSARFKGRGALVVINRGGATGKNVLDFAEAVVASVKEKFGVTLNMEVNVID